MPLRISRRWSAVVGVLAISAAALGVASIAGKGGAMLGASAGQPVAFSIIPLPEVIGNGGSDEFVLQRCAFAPSFEQLTGGETIVTSDAQMRHIWRRLFAIPYDASLFDFDESFVVLAGQHLPDNASISISQVDAFVADYESALEFEKDTQEPALSVTVEVLYGGPPPKTKDYFYRMSAASIDWEHFDDIIFHRQSIFAP